ncbi:CLUMA_CG015185, isoform A [Clunio marinus]|uniref:CLUMA_CG015185, isoform A n=1 Tax=Clunio marinus TaxID=568069 RepID=A0A1J1IQT3_9DIPT|nr:CLUMA_CG015185, isoform A [Clunio marinus]
MENLDSLVKEMTEVSRKQQDLSNYENISENLKQMIRASFHEEVQIHFFGSRIIGLAEKDSDLDIYIEFNKSFFANAIISKTNDERLLKLAKIICHAPNWCLKETVLRTRIPIIISVYNPLNMDCDISTTNGLSTENSKLLAYLFKIQPEAVSLFHFIREWLKTKNFTQFKGYTLTLLLTFFLQQKCLMPTISAVQNAIPEVRIDGFNVSFDNSRSLNYYKISKITDYKNHVQSFFQFYADFDFSKVMCLFTGKSIALSNYKQRYPKFLAKGIYLPGPCNRASNGGVVDFDYKTRFVNVCTISPSCLELFFNNNLKL